MCGRTYTRELSVLTKILQDFPQCASSFCLPVGTTEPGRDMVFPRARGDLLWALQSGPMPIGVACTIMNDALNALATLHNSLRTAHDDIKPENILIFSDGTTRLIDFGSAKLILDKNGQERDDLNVPRLPPTAVYASPEAPRTYRRLDKQDMYSVGLVFATMLAGSNIDEYRKMWRIGCIDSEEMEGLIERLLSFDAMARPSVVEVIRTLWKHRAPRSEVKKYLNRRYAKGRRRKAN